MVDGPDDVRDAPRPARRRSRPVASREPSLTMMISNVSARAGSVSSASSTRPARFASSLWAGKKYDSAGDARPVTGAAVGRRRGAGTPVAAAVDPADVAGAAAHASGVMS